MSAIIPVKINPGFFITAALIGFINSFNLLGTLIWMLIILISVLVHEFGHALTSKVFGQNPRIELVAFGGLTIPDGPKLRPWKEFIVIFMGPLFGFLLFVLATIILQLFTFTPLITTSLQWFRFVNLFWTFINLLPILPLDGGQLVRVVFESFLGSKGWRVALGISIFFSLFFTVLFFLWGFYIIAIFFILFAMQNIETFRRMRNYGEADQLDENQELLNQIEILLAANRFDEATPKLEFLIEKSQSGLIHTVASEYLAKIYFDHAQYQRAYQILSPIENYISKEALCLLFIAAYEVKDYEKVVQLSGPCFEERKTVDIALRAAASNSLLHNFPAALEWLRTIKTFGHTDLSKLTSTPDFDPLRSQREFQELMK